MQQRHVEREAYFEEQARTARKYYIPYINKHIGVIPDRVLEVGCGEGGNLLPFAELGCEVIGVDMALSRIDQARSFFAGRKQKGTFIPANIFQLEALHQLFPLVIVHDVIEHIEDKEAFLSGLHKFLTPDGFIFVAFPAWQMPFGGHQQIAHGRIVSHLPFIHLLPSFFYKSILQAFGEKKTTIAELLSIKRTGCTVEYFRSVVSRTGYKIINQQLFLVNPHYETKFGITPRKLNQPISLTPYLRNFLSTSCFYILKKGSKPFLLSVLWLFITYASFVIF